MRAPSVLPHVISGLMTVIALQAYGAAVEAQAPCNALTIAVIVGTTISLLVRLAGKGGRWLSVGSWLGLLLGTLGWFGCESLNDLVPSGMLLDEAQMGAAVAWLLTLRTLVLWTDADVAFQAVPAMALFGLAGQYAQDDTTLVVFFILYVVCLAYMLAWYQSRGVRTGGDGGRTKAHPTASAATSPSYALVSIGVVVGASFLVAPIVQTTIEHTVGPAFRAAAASRVGPPGRFQPRVFDDLDLVGGSHASTNAQVLRVTADRPLYLRERAFGEFTGIRWRSVGAGPSGREPGFRVDGRDADLTQVQSDEIRSRMTEVTQEILVMSGVHYWLCSASEPRSIMVSRNPDSRFVSRLAYFPEVGLQCPAGLATGARYVVVSALPTERSAELARARAGRDSGVYTELPLERSPRLHDTAIRATEGIRGDYERVEALRKYVARTCKYSTNAPPLTSPQDRVSEFLFTVRVGYCDAYAASLCCLCRELGMQARVVRGYAPGDYDRDTGTYIVREKHYHLWTEVRFVGLGWLIFDATDGTTDLDATPDAAAATDASHSLLRSPWVTALIDATVVLILAYLAVSAYRQRRRSAPGMSPRGQIGLAYAEFLTSLQRAGFRGRRPPETPIEHLAIVMPSLPLQLAAAADDIVRRVNTALFGSAESPEAAGVIQRLVRDWSKEMRELRRKRR